MRNRQDVHVMRDELGWNVTCAGLTISIHRRQLHAIAKGVDLARRAQVDLVTHPRNGRIRSLDIYGHELRARL